MKSQPAETCSTIESGPGAPDDRVAADVPQQFSQDPADRVTQPRLIETYRRYAPLYDMLFGGVLEHGRRCMAKRVGELKPASLLEIGVGTGLTLFRYPPAAKIVGVDISPEMLSRAQAKAERLGDRDISLLSMNAEQLSFPDESFDCVTLPYVLSVTPDPLQLIKETRRVCKKKWHDPDPESFQRQSLLAVP